MITIRDTARIANGKILPKGGHSKTGVATDSIYMEIQFSDETIPEETPRRMEPLYQSAGRPEQDLLKMIIKINSQLTA